MNITIPSNATTQSIKTAHPVPRGATHFRYTASHRKPVIDAIKNLDTLAGCTGKLEYGKVTFRGRGRHAKINTFTALGVASDPAPVTPPPAESASEQAAPQEATPEEPIPEEPAPQEPAPAKAIPQEPAPAEPAPATGHPRREKLNRIFGHSACAVAKALGKVGVNYAEADRIFRAHGIEMPKASLSVQLGFGRNSKSWERHGNPAELTEAQVAELRAKATE